METKKELCWCIVTLSPFLMPPGDYILKPVNMAGTNYVEGHISAQPFPLYIRFMTPLQHTTWERFAAKGTVAHYEHFILLPRLINN